MSLFGAQAAMGAVNHAFMYTMTENTQNVSKYNILQRIATTTTIEKFKIGIRI